MARRQTAPPRPIAPGDVVAGYSDELGEWTAAQVTHLDAEFGCAGVLDLTWSGPEPSRLDDLGALEPLRLDHHEWTGTLSHCWFDWTLPRSCTVMGAAPVLVSGPPNGWSTGWQMGLQLDLQRRWDAGDADVDGPGVLDVSAVDLAALTRPPDGIWDLTVRGIVDLDCHGLVRAFPSLRRLHLSGRLGTLEHADALNDLRRLRRLRIDDLFGMTAADAPQVGCLPSLESLGLHSVPTDYAAASRTAWAGEIRNGTHVEIRSPRKPGWVAENRDNPLREWDGREHISSARYRKAVAQYRTTRAAVLEALTDGSGAVRLSSIGRDYGEAFNRLDGGRNPFIETEEREDLFAALDAAVDFAESQLGRPFPIARQQLVEGLDAVRDW